ncbi:MAG: Ca-activated chloride channel, partial [Solirubrobacteraceae bacterium]|nr:Ca-activated chloride channel [Solirubrobacteraceae bacterium]
MLVILDGSDSMNEDAGDGGNRLDAAKSALGELIDAVPEGANVGLRVYGSEVSDVSRAEGCRDTKLVSPVAPLDRDDLRAKV